MSGGDGRVSHDPTSRLVSGFGAKDQDTRQLRIILDWSSDHCFAGLKQRLNVRDMLLPQRGSLPVSGHRLWATLQQRHLKLD